MPKIDQKSNNIGLFRAKKLKKLAYFDLNPSSKKNAYFSISSKTLKNYSSVKTPYFLKILQTPEENSSGQKNNF